jgi:hypothetical protein
MRASWAANGCAQAKANAETAMSFFMGGAARTADFQVNTMKSMSF